MIFVALKRLWDRKWLSLLSVAAVTLSIGLVASIPIFAKAVSFVVLRQELGALCALSGRPPLSLRIYVLPGTDYELSTAQVRDLAGHIGETLSAETGLPLVLLVRHMETSKLTLRTGGQETVYGAPHTTLLQDASLTVLPDIESRLIFIDGDSMSSARPSENILNVWMLQATAAKLGVAVDEVYEVYDSRRLATFPVRLVGTYQVLDPHDPYWFQNPDLMLSRTLLSREADYAALAEPFTNRHLGFASWYLVLDDSHLTSENMQVHTAGLQVGQNVVARYLPEPRIDGSPLGALERTLKRESDLILLMLSFSVPMLGFLLYFVTLISKIAIRWQRRETAIMVSRGMRGRQLLAVGAIEAGVLVALGLPLGLLVAVQLAQVMGYTQSFMRFTWRDPLPISPTAIHIPLLLATISALFLARLLPVFRALRTSVVAHERRRARAPERPFWQRFYLDVLLLIPVFYAYRQLVRAGTLVPQANAPGEMTIQDPLLFLVPALFALVLSLLMTRLFPLLMRIGDWLSTLGRQTTFYLAFRQLARQSNQYTSALLLVIISLSLGGFMASMAVSLDQWLLDQIYYEVGSDVLLEQMLDPEYVEAGLIPPSGAWMLPIESYLALPGVVDATRVGMYEATFQPSAANAIRGTFIGVDRLDLPQVLFFRPDFAPDTLGGLMNALALREDGVLLSDRFLQESGLKVGEKVVMRVTLVDVILNKITLRGEFTVVGSYAYFPTVYEEGEQAVAVIGNLDYLFARVGGPELHHIWLKIEPDASKTTLLGQVEEMGVFVKNWIEARDLIAFEQSRAERMGIFGTLTIGFMSSALFAGIGLWIYNYASLQERLFRFTILRTVGLSRLQVVSQVAVEYTILMAYSVLGGVGIGAWAARLFIPFFQAADQAVLRPPTMIPIIAWVDIGRIAGVFILVLVLAQFVVIAAALGRGVFQALRLGDQE